MSLAGSGAGPWLGPDVTFTDVPTLTIRRGDTVNDVLDRFAAEHPGAVLVNYDREQLQQLVDAVNGPTPA